MSRNSLGICALVLTLAAVTTATQNPNSPASSSPETFTMRVVTTGLDVPWEMTWGPDAQLWVTERRGKRVTRVNPATGAKSTLVAIPEVHESVGQDGLLGMALHPALLRGTASDFVYVAFTYDDAPGPNLIRKTAIRRYTYDAPTRRLIAPMDLITGLPAFDDHNSGRLIFGPDQRLYFTVGDQGSNFGRNRCNPNRAQELPSAGEVNARDWTRYQGKILRMNLDGSIPADNPTLGGARSHIFSYGHRNPQGLGFGPDGKLYATEHGPNTDDEVNLIEAGKNYGWPHVAGFKDDQVYVYANWSASKPEPCSSLLTVNIDAVPPSVPAQKESAWSHPDFRQPLQTLFTVPNGYDFQARGPATIAPASLDVYVGSSGGIPGWANSLLVPSLLRGRVYRLKLTNDGRSVTGEPVEYFKAANRYRDIAINPDNQTIYLATDLEGPTMTSSGTPTRALENPGAILEFKYIGAGGTR